MKRAPKVLVISAPPTPYRTPQFSRIAADPDVDIHVLFCGATEPTRDWKQTGPMDFSHEFLSGRYLTVGRQDQYFYFVNPGILSALRRYDYDAAVVWGWWLSSAVVAMMRSRFHRKPYIVFSETHALGHRSRLKRRVRDAFVGQAVRGASAYLATGTLSKQHLLHYGAREDRVFFFPNTPDVDELSRRSADAREKRIELRARFGIPADAPVILFLGRFVPKKGLQHLVPAFKRVLEKLPEARLLLGGDGPMRGELEQLAQPLNGRVVFPGFVQPEAVHELYVAADVMCSPSLNEPWGVVNNEAMACGLPLVVSDAVGAAPDLVHEPENGRVVRAGDEEHLAFALTDVLSDPKRLAKMGDRSREIVSRWDYRLGVESFKRAVEYALAEPR